MADQASPIKSEKESVYAISEEDKNSDKYKKAGLKFDQKFGENKFDLKYLEDVAKRLDDKFKILADLAKESEASTCDVFLFKNVRRKRE
jgi:hypothetical protein